MIQHCGLWFPDDVGTAWEHALRHVGSLEWAIEHCRRHRTVVQAGGNVGLWPRRLAGAFARVITFEPEPLSLACLVANVPQRVEVHEAALGAESGRCAISRKGLGSHKTIAGDDVEVVTVDSLGLDDLDFLQLDVEGYEWHALKGAEATLDRCRPLVQVEIRRFTEHYGQSAIAIRELLARHDYHLVSRQPGKDFVFQGAK